MVTMSGTWAFKGNQQKEDLHPLLVQIGYEGRPLSEVLPDAGSKSDRTEWVERDVAARALNSQVQGYAYTLSAGSAGTRRANLTQIMTKMVSVTGTSEAVDLVGGSAIADQTQLRLLEYANDIEYNLWNATVVSGTSDTTAQQMDGIIAWAFRYGNTTAGKRSWTTTNSGVSLNTTNLSNMQVRMRKSGLKLTDFFCDEVIRRRVSLSTTPISPYRTQQDREIVEAVGVVNSDFGQSELRTVLGDIDQPLWSLGSTGHLVLGLDRSMAEKAWLRTTTMSRIPPREDAVSAVIKGELTLRVWSSSAIQVDWNVF